SARVTMPPSRDLPDESVGRGASRSGASRPVERYSDRRSEEDSSPTMSSRRTFVGRARELDDVASAFDDARAGRGALFLLVGGAAIGKPRLGDELSRRAEEHGLQPLWGRCWETGG